MGFFKKDVIKSCKTDKETGAIVCKSSRKTAEGEQILASVKKEVDGNCTILDVEAEEFEDGALAELNKFANVKASTTCRAKNSGGLARPEDY